MKNNFFSKSWRPFRDLTWGINDPKKIKPDPTLLFFQPKKSLVIERYGYQSVRIDLISISRQVLDRNEKNEKHFLLQTSLDIL